MHARGWTGRGTNRPRRSSSQPFRRSMASQEPCAPTTDHPSHLSRLVGSPGSLYGEGNSGSSRYVSHRGSASKTDVMRGCTAPSRKRQPHHPPPRLAPSSGGFSASSKKYNELRPHEALGQEPPATVYHPSDRSYPGLIREPVYPAAWRSGWCAPTARSSGRGRRCS